MKTDVGRKIWNGRVVFFPPLSISLSLSSQFSCEEPNQRKVGPQSGRDMASQMERLSNTKRNAGEDGWRGSAREPLFIEAEQDLVE